MGRKPPPQPGAGKAMLHPKHLALFVVALLLIAALFYTSRNGRRGSLEMPPATTAAPGATPANAVSPKPPEAVADNAQDRGAALLQEGNRLLQEGKPEQAVERYREAGRLLPEDEDVHYNLGIALARLGRIKEAIGEYEAALKLFPGYAEVHNNLGNLLLRNGKADEAIGHFRAAIKAVPDYASAYNNLGNAQLLTGQVEDAAASFTKAVQLNTNYWEGRFNLGNIHIRQGRTNEAAAEYREVLRLNPGFKPAEDALAGRPPQPPIP